MSKCEPKKSHGKWGGWKKHDGWRNDCHKDKHEKKDCWGKSKHSW